VSRWKASTALIVLLLLIISGLASGQEVYEVQYSVVSGGRDALIHLLILTYVPYCPPLSGIDCANATMGEVLGGDEYLLYFNGSRLYLLNFTPALKTPYQTYNGAVFINGSWYINITAYPQNASPDESIRAVYYFNPRRFCVEKTNLTWSELPHGKPVDEIDGWRIELQSSSFEKWGYANVSDVWVTMSRDALKWSPGPTEVVNSSRFPIYFILRRGNRVRNVTLVYLNLNITRPDFRVPPNTSVPGYWFPRDVKIVNVTVCNSAGLHVKFPVTGLRVIKAYPGGEGVLLVVGYEVLSPGMCPGNPFNCTLVPDMVSSYLFYVSSSGPYFLGAYPEEPVVKFENGLWRLKLRLWNGSVENATFNPTCLNDSNVSPVEVPKVPIEWTSVKVGNFTVSYPAEFLGYSWGCNCTLEIQNRKILRVLPYVPFAVGVNGKFYPLFEPARVTSQPVPPKVSLSFGSLASTAPGETKTKTICGPGLVTLLAVTAVALRRLRDTAE